MKLKKEKLYGEVRRKYLEKYRENYLIRYIIKVIEDSNVLIWYSI